MRQTGGMRGLCSLVISLAILAGLARSAEAQTGAQAFLDALYRPYLTEGFAGQSLDRPEQYFSPAVAQAITRDAREAARREEPPVLNGDPFIDAQDWDVRDLVVSASEIEPGRRATGTVTFRNQGTPRRLTVDLVMTPAGWRIDDIHKADSSLRTYLKVR